jgi:hypothetical protein
MNIFERAKERIIAVVEEQSSHKKRFAKIDARSFVQMSEHKDYLGR